MSGPPKSNEPDRGDGPRPPKGPGLLARLGTRLAALGRAIRRAPWLVLGWLRRNLPYVAAAAWLAGMGLFIGVTAWRGGTTWREARALRREAAEAELKAKVEAEVAAQLAGVPAAPDGGALAAGTKGGPDAQPATLASAAAARRNGPRTKPGRNPGNTVDLVDLDELQKARGGSDEGLRQALPEGDEASAEDGEEVAVADAGVRGAVNALQAIARARGGGGQENIDRETRQLLGATEPGKAAAGSGDDDGRVDVKMPPGGMAAWIARNQHKKVRVGDKETLAILAEVRGGPAPAAGPPAGAVAAPAPHAAAVPGAAPAPVAGTHAPVAPSAAPDAGAAPVVRAKTAAPDAGAAPVVRAKTDAGAPAAPAARAVPAAPVAEAPFDLEAAGLAALRAVLEPPATKPGHAADEKKEAPVVAAVLDAASVRASFAPLVSGGALEIGERGRAPVLRLPARTMFRGDGSTEVRGEGRELLRRVAGLLGRWPQSRLEIVGPAEAAAGTAGVAAWARSATRAVDVARVLAANGIAPGRITALVVAAPPPAGDPVVEIVLLPATPTAGAR